MPVELSSLARYPIATAHRIAALPPDSAPAAGPGAGVVDASFLDARQRTQRFTRPGWKPQAASPDFKPFGDDGLTFDDLLDAINPLQQLPIIGSLYRWLTGDQISPAARIAGGALFGGPIGIAGAIGGLIVNGVMGGNAEQGVMVALLGPSPAGETPAADPPSLAAASQPAPAAPALPENALAPSSGRPAIPAAAPSAMPSPAGPVELDGASEAALLEFIARQTAPGSGAVPAPGAPPTIDIGPPTAAGDIGPPTAAGLDLPGSIPLAMSRAYDSYRRQQLRADGALAPEIEFDIRN